MFKDFEVQGFSVDTSYEGVVIYTIHPVAPPKPASTHHTSAPIDRILDFRLGVKRQGGRLGDLSKEGLLASHALTAPWDSRVDDRLAGIAIMLGAQVVVQELSDDVCSSLATLPHDGLCVVPKLFDRPFLLTHQSDVSRALAVIPVATLDQLALIGQRLDDTARERAENAVARNQQAWIAVEWDVGPEHLGEVATVFLAEDVPTAWGGDGMLAEALKLGSQYSSMSRPLTSRDQGHRAKSIVRRGVTVEEESVGWTVRYVSLNPNRPKAAPPSSRDTSTASPPAAPVPTERTENPNLVESEVTVSEHTRMQAYGPGRKSRKELMIASHPRRVHVCPNKLVKVAA
jgi:hypothetical protein